MAVLHRFYCTFGLSFRNVQGNKLIIWLGGGFQNQPYQVQVGRIASLSDTMSGKNLGILNDQDQAVNSETVYET